VSGSGAPALAVDGTGLRVAVVAASWHDVVMDGLLDGARRGLRDAALKDVFTVRVPGTFELPVAAARLAADPQIDAIVALGVVIRGGTPHFDYVCQAATTGLTEAFRALCVIGDRQDQPTQPGGARCGCVPSPCHRPALPSGLVGDDRRSGR